MGVWGIDESLKWKLDSFTLIVAGHGGYLDRAQRALIVVRIRDGADELSGHCAHVPGHDGHLNRALLVATASLSK